LCLGAGVPPAEAAEFANLAAVVTVRKLFTTGTATGTEILEVGRRPDYIYAPELAADPRKARYLADSEIEVCAEPRVRGRVMHALFDHDGCISTLRQGWESVMAPVMIRAVLGDEYERAGKTLYDKVRSRVMDYIDKSTGIQTIVQMEALVEMVREFDVVPPEKRLDKFGYKQRYHEALIGIVRERIEKFGRGELDLSDFTVKGAVHFLEALSERGVQLYLASGTDREDVVAEADALGYARLFGGRIYGAVGDVAKYSKRMVIEGILTEHGLEGPDLAVFGDGPVEIREGRRRNGLAIGIASDEIRRHGRNMAKRARLVRAGAHYIAPDFSQPDRLLDALFPSRER
jgi:phosphoglycolate phosphatase-like HAD superfamily hydrolase